MDAYQRARTALEERIVAATSHRDEDYWLDELIALMVKHDKELADA